MPSSFSTPMFWTEDELGLLIGTDIEGWSGFMREAYGTDRVGRSEAETRYKSLLGPILLVRTIGRLTLI
jgi:hypothetical protein